MARRHRDPKPLCVTCGFQLAAPGKGECSTCAGYRRRTGLQRPPAVIATHARRLLGPATAPASPEPEQTQLPLSA